MHNFLIIGILAFSMPSYTQTMTIITTLTDGSRDTVKIGFVPDATLGEDIALGEQNVFMSPVNGYEGRILQRDSTNFSCAEEIDGSRIYYPDNFDSKINYRNPEDTSLQNRLFEIWYSDEQTDSVELICDIPIRSFLFTAHQYIIDCFGDPPSPMGILVIQDDTIKHIKYATTFGLGIKQLIVFAKPAIQTTSLDEMTDTDEKMDINVYPNPTSGKLSVQSPNAQEIREILIYDSIGHSIGRFDPPSVSTEIDLSPYSSGMYVGVFVLRNGERVSKVILKQ